MILTRHHLYSSENEAATVARMDRRTARSIAFDLVDTDLADHGQLTRLVVDHTLAPLRVACGLAAPQQGEDMRDVLGEVTSGEGIRITTFRSWSPRPTPDVFDPVFRAMLLFGWLFPGCVAPADRTPLILEAPGQKVLRETHWLLMRTHDEVADLVAALLGQPTNPALTGIRRAREGVASSSDATVEDRVIAGFVNPRHRPARNDDAMAELAQMRQLVARSLDLRPESEPAIDRIEIGLDQMGWWPAHYVDRVLRKEVQHRLVWLGHLEFEMDIDDAGEPVLTDRIVGTGRGVFSALVPETISGLVLLDLTEQLGPGGTAARCAHCGRLFALNTWQRGRHNKGEAVYHKECHREHRAAAIREHHRARYVPRPRKRVVA